MKTYINCSTGGIFNISQTELPNFSVFDGEYVPLVALAFLIELKSSIIEITIITIMQVSIMMIVNVDGGQNFLIPDTISSSS